jgi:hypothetical protein
MSSLVEPVNSRASRAVKHRRDKGPVDGTCLIDGPRGTGGARVHPCPYVQALRRVATLGDGWHAAFPTPQALGEGLGRLRAGCGQAGRDAATLAISARLGLSAKRPAAELLGELRALRDLGVAHVILEPRQRD